MKKSRILIPLYATIFAFLSLVVVASAPSPAAPRAPVEVPILQCPLGCGPYEVDQVVAKFVGEKHPWLRLIPVETPGWIFNLKEMSKSQDKWKTHIFGFSTGAEWLGREAIKPFFETRTVLEGRKFLFMDDMLAIGTFFMTLDRDIKTLSDLKGKRIGIGLRGQSHWGGYAKVFLEAEGVTEKNSKIDFLGGLKAVEALLDGRVDAAVSGVHLEVNLKGKVLGPPLTQLGASGRKFFYVAPRPETIDKVNQTLNAPFLKVKLAAGFLPHQTEDIVVAADIGGKAAHASFPEDLAYEISKAYIQFGPELGRFQALGQLVTREMLVTGLTKENTHPGAIRAFKEAGLWKGK